MLAARHARPNSTIMPRPVAFSAAQLEATAVPNARVRLQLAEQQPGGEADEQPHHGDDEHADHAEARGPPPRNGSGMLCCLSFRPVRTALAAMPARTKTMPDPEDHPAGGSGAAPESPGQQARPDQDAAGKNGDDRPGHAHQDGEAAQDRHDNLGVHRPSLWPGGCRGPTGAGAPEADDGAASPREAPPSSSVQAVATRLPPPRRLRRRQPGPRAGPAGWARCSPRKGHPRPVPRWPGPRRASWPA